MKLWIYIVRRMLLLIPVVIGVMTITFLIISAVPVNERMISQFGAKPSHGGVNPYTEYPPCTALGINKTGNCLNPQWTYYYDKLGLNQPVPVQWGLYIYNAFTGNWGVTNPGSAAVALGIVPAGYPVITVIGWFLPFTLELAFLALILILALAIPIGNLSAVYRNRPFDQASRVISFSGFALPFFLLGTLGLIGATELFGGAVKQCDGFSSVFFQFYNSWPSWYCLPPGGVNVQPTFIHTYLNTGPTGFPTIDSIIYAFGGKVGSTQWNVGWYLAGDTIVRLIIPALVITFGSLAGILRYVRNSMLEVMNLDFVRTARAKGVPERLVVRRHAGRNSLMVTITILGLTFAFFIVGFPVLEDVFHLRGLGLLFTDSILPPTYDYGLIFGTTILFTLIVVAANLIVDVLYAYLDPRVRLG
jgi:ABC-type dipeptide/oligopeptide/nickel transport system permease component